MASGNMVSLSHSALSLYSEVCKPVCQELGIGQTAFDILMLLGTKEEVQTASDVAQAGGIKRNLVSMNVEKLAEQGYLVRQPIPGDRRQVRLCPTEKAQTILAKGLKVQEYYYHFLIQGLSQEELAIYRKCADTIAENVAQLSRLLRGDQGSRSV